MQDDTVERQRTPARLFRAAAFLLLATFAWLARVSLPHGSATLELDPSYQQVVGAALARGLAFGREIVFTSGPLAWFTFSPYEPELYWQKLWLWEVLLGVTLAALHCARLLRRGTWLEVALGALILFVIPRRGDEWLFATGLLAGDLGLEALSGRAAAWPRRLRILAGAVAVALLAVLALVKVTSLALALGVLGVLCLRALASGGPGRAMRWLAGWAAAQCLLWVAIGQELADLPRFFATSIELSSGFDAAMSLPAAPATLALCGGLLLVLLLACAWHARRPAGAASGRWLDTARAQALLVALALGLAWKTGLTRADHVVTFFGVAMLAPLFLLPIEARGPAGSVRAWRPALARCAVAALAVVAGIAARDEDMRTPASIATACMRRVHAAAVWLSSAREVEQRLARARGELLAAWRLPRIRALAGDRPIAGFTFGDCVLLLDDYRWRPRPVFHAFSVFTEDSARRNADDLAGAGELVLLRVSTIDHRLPSSEDPLALQVLLREFELLAHESGFLLLARAPRGPRAPTAGRTRAAAAAVAWNERFALPDAPGPAGRDEPLVLRGSVRASRWGRARAAVYQTPEVFVSAELEDGNVARHRIAPFALEAGVVIRPWLPTNAAWIDAALGRPAGRVVALTFETPVPAAFEPALELEVLRAPDLAPRPIAEGIARELVLGAAGEIPARYESAREPEVSGWVDLPPMLFAHAPASLWYPAGPGAATLGARLSIPAFLAGSPGFPGFEVLVQAREDGAVRDCARFELGVGAAGATTIDVEGGAELRSAGEIGLCIRPLPGEVPDYASVGVRKVRVRR